VRRCRVSAGLSAAGADARRLQARGHSCDGVGARPLARPADEQPPAAPAVRRRRDPELPCRRDTRRRRTLLGADRLGLRPAYRRVEAHVPPTLACRIAAHPHQAHQNQLGGRNAVITRPAAITPIQQASETPAKSRAAGGALSSGPSPFSSRAAVRLNSTMLSPASASSAIFTCHAGL